MLEHIERVAEALFEAVRVTKKGGYLDLRAPDYRQPLPLDNHYYLPWPRFMPREHALRWVEAMGRPAVGIDTFFYVTMPQILALLDGLGSRVLVAELWQHFPNGKRPFTGSFGQDPIFFESTADIAPIAKALQEAERQGRLPDIYCRPVEFVIIAQRL